MPGTFNWSFPTFALTAGCLVASVVLALRWLRERKHSQKAVDKPQSESDSAIVNEETTALKPESRWDELEPPSRATIPQDEAAAVLKPEPSTFPQDDLKAANTPDYEDLRIQSPAAERSSPPNGSPPNMCLNCGKYDGKMLRCSRCASVCFCSVECQRVSWKTHKSDCARLAKQRDATSPSKASLQNAQASAAKKPCRVSSNPVVAQHQEDGAHLVCQGYHSEALAAFERMKCAAQEAGLRNDEGHALRLIGDTLNTVSAPPADVEDAYKKAIKVAYEKDDMELSFYCLSGMASHACRDDVDDVDLAEHFYLQALTLAQRVLTHDEEGLAEGNLATCLAKTAARRSDSFSHFRKAIALQKGSLHSKSQLHLSLASALRADGKFKEAHAEYKRSLACGVEMQDREVEITSLTALAELYESELSEPNCASECREQLAALHT